MGYILILILTTIGVYLLGERILSVPDSVHPYLWRWWESWLALGTIVLVVLIALSSGGMSSMLPWVAGSFCAVLGLLFALALIVSQPAGVHHHLIEHHKPAHKTHQLSSARHLISGRFLGIIVGKKIHQEQ